MMAPLPQPTNIKRSVIFSELFLLDTCAMDVQTIITATIEYNELDDREHNTRVTLFGMQNYSNCTKAKQLELAVAWKVWQGGYDLSRPPENRPFIFDESLINPITASARTRTPNQPPRFVTTIWSLVVEKTISDRQKTYKTTLAEDIAL